MKIINTKKAPAAIGPYVQGICAGDFLFVSGQIPFNPETMKVPGNDIKSQANQSLLNLKAIIEAAGCDMTDVVRCGIFLKDMNDFAIANEVYGEFFSQHKPTRACVEVARLPKDVLIEIEATVYLKNKK